MTQEETKWEPQDYCFSTPDSLLGKSVVLYGAGKVGRNYYTFLSRYEKIHILLWVDKHPEKYNYDYHGISPVSEIANTDYDVIILAILKKSVADEIATELEKAGIPRSKIIWQEPEKKTIPKKNVGRNIIRIMGGLGNQMFQYALYISLNKRGLETEANIQAYTNPDERPFELFKAFPNLRMDIDAANDFDAYRNPMNTHKLYPEKQDGVYDDDVFHQKDVSFNGYWQTEKYFTDIKDEIRDDFTFDLSDVSLKKFADILLQKDNTVSVHVRRGDYFKAGNADLYGGICTVDYYKKAIEYISGRVENPQHVVFSDDLTWTKENLDIQNAVFVSSGIFSSYKNWYDMYLMSLCKHNIIANSSFSWWGAWLNRNPGKIVVAPAKWLNGHSTADIWCDAWVKI